MESIILFYIGIYNQKDFFILMIFSPEYLKDDAICENAKFIFDEVSVWIHMKYLALLDRFCLFLVLLFSALLIVLW